MATTTTSSQSTPKPRKDLVTKVGNIGRLDNDRIELRITPNGKSVCNFDIAVTTGKGDDKTTEWYRVTCWESLAENVSSCLTTGNRVIVWGVPDINEYTDREGNTRKQKTINAWSVGIDLNFQLGTVQKIERDNRFNNQDEPF